jgi:hypothetical protein
MWILLNRLGMLVVIKVRYKHGIQVWKKIQVKKRPEWPGGILNWVVRFYSKAMQVFRDSVSIRYETARTFTLILSFMWELEGPISNKKLVIHTGRPIRS